jgi:hypothetical protein
VVAASHRDGRGAAHGYRHGRESSGPHAAAGASSASPPSPTGVPATPPSGSPRRPR